jgi:hypothetical protein
VGVGMPRPQLTIDKGIRITVKIAAVPVDLESLLTAL